MLKGWIARLVDGWLSVGELMANHGLEPTIVSGNDGWTGSQIGDYAIGFLWLSDDKS